MRRAVVVLCALAVVLGGCARGDGPTKPIRTIEPQDTASSPSPETPNKDSQGCRLLTSKERRSIAGRELDVIAPSAPSKDTLRCRWVSTLSTPVPTRLTIMTTPTQRWLLGFPQRVASTIASGRGESKYTKRLLAAKKKVIEGADKIGDKEACGIFSLLIEANGGGKSASEFVLFQPAPAGAVTATVQMCTHGVYTLLTYDEKGLAPSTPLGDALLRLVKIAHKRAIKIL
jgi:hypothetical protein